MGYSVIAWNFTRKRFEIVKEGLYSLQHAKYYVEKIPQKKKISIAPDEIAHKVLIERIHKRYGGSYKKIYTNTIKAKDIDPETTRKNAIASSINGVLIGKEEQEDTSPEYPYQRSEDGDCHIKYQAKTTSRLLFPTGTNSAKTLYSAIRSEANCKAHGTVEECKSHIELIKRGESLLINGIYFEVRILDENNKVVTPVAPFTIGDALPELNKVKTTAVPPIPPMPGQVSAHAPVAKKLTMPKVPPIPPMPVPTRKVLRRKIN